jgi:hypothetical protein
MDPPDRFEALSRVAGEGLLLFRRRMETRPSRGFLAIVD